MTCNARVIISAIYNECVPSVVVSFASSRPVFCCLYLELLTVNTDYCKTVTQQTCNTKVTCITLEWSMSRSLSSVWSFVPAHRLTSIIRVTRVLSLALLTTVIVDVYVWPLVHFTWQVPPLFSSDGDGSMIRFSGIVEKVSSTWKRTSMCVGKSFEELTQACRRVMVHRCCILP